MCVSQNVGLAVHTIGPGCDLIYLGRSVAKIYGIFQGAPVLIRSDVIEGERPPTMRRLAGANRRVSGALAVASTPLLPESRYVREDPISSASSSLCNIPGEASSLVPNFEDQAPGCGLSSETKRLVRLERDCSIFRRDLRHDAVSSKCSAKKRCIQANRDAWLFESASLPSGSARAPQQKCSTRPSSA